jgi:tetratricopeptide (TPR) repeat protein
MKQTTFFRVNRPYLPRISRIFPERVLIFLFSGLFIGIIASYLAMNPQLVKVHPISTALPLVPNTKRSTFVRSYEVWKNIVAQKPEYRDGYIMLAYYAKEIGKSDESKEYLKKVLSLDPNYQIPEVLLVEKQ